MFSKLLVFGEMPVILAFSKLLGLITCEGWGAQPKRHSVYIVDLRRIYACMRGGCKTGEEDKDGVQVLGEVK